MFLKKGPALANRVRHIHVDICSDRSTDLCRPSETYFDWASVDTYSDSSIDLCRPDEEHFDWTLSNWIVGKVLLLKMVRRIYLENTWTATSYFLRDWVKMILELILLLPSWAIIPQNRIVIKNKFGENLVGVFHETGSKELVILCHGFRSTKEFYTFVNLADAITREGISVFQFDFAGNGKPQIGEELPLPPPPFD
ncbi:hypothetical protein QJS10_CPB18g00772 [Acorus calamus]|uniref:Serine aminopeptidase S33 domain-containing protein n=1 Tax=Acorus calamus TaxID=4465 RepID=A0AAV9CLG8_ACOCL|nr:hypothetical protein QJS10_CPB18g00772 [Acorus calamus]